MQQRLQICPQRICTCQDKTSLINYFSQNSFPAQTTPPISARRWTASFIEAVSILLLSVSEKESKKITRKIPTVVRPRLSCDERKGKVQFSRFQFARIPQTPLHRIRFQFSLSLSLTKLLFYTCVTFNHDSDSFFIALLARER